jgi:hypothetical protein
MSKVNQDYQLDDFDIETVELTVHPRASTTVALAIPNETMTALERVAASRDMSLEGLLKLYIGRSLRQDLTQEFIKQHP